MEKRPAFTTRFILLISILYACFIIGTALLFSFTVSYASDALQATAIDSYNEMLAEKTAAIAGTLAFRPRLSVRKAQKMLARAIRSHPEILSVLFFARTRDENYFRLKKIIPGNSDIDPGIRRGETIADRSGSDYLKQGLVHAITDPMIYSKGSYSWQNVYQPIVLKKKAYVLQFMIYPKAAAEIQAYFNAISSRGTKLMIVFSVIIIFAIATITLLFVHNHSVLMKNLSAYMLKAAKGNFDISIASSSDSELNELASSFNTLIEEMKTISVSASQTQDEDTVGAPEPAEDALLARTVFKTGVARLKAGLYDEAVTLFTITAESRADNFSSLFNLGVAYAKSSRYEQALAMFTRAGEADPSYELTEKYIDRVRKFIRTEAPVS